jgi:hypothetical protein
MQTISTKYVGPTNYRGSRIIATSASGRKITVSYDPAVSSESAHMNGVIALAEKLGWKGTMSGGHTKDGMVWVFAGGYSVTF